MGVVDDFQSYEMTANCFIRKIYYSMSVTDIHEDTTTTSHLLLHFFILLRVACAFSSSRKTESSNDESEAKIDRSYIHTKEDG